MEMTLVLPEIKSNTMESSDKNIFINCPYDEEYYTILRPLLFTILYLGFIPRMALDRSDSGEPRLEKIKNLISQSQYSIHDISRLLSSKRKEFYRLNMPFELGFDYGYRCFSNNSNSTKRFLILEKERYRYMSALSDINGLDIKSHQDNPEVLVTVVRNWFVETVGMTNVKSPTVIWYKYLDFNSALYDKKTNEGFTDRDINYMPISELIANIRDFIQNDDKSAE